LVVVAVVVDMVLLMQIITAEEGKVVPVVDLGTKTVIL
jgi:hypothetical protein